MNGRRIETQVGTNSPFTKCIQWNRNNKRTKMCEVIEETETATKRNPEKHRRSNWQKDQTKIKPPFDK